MNKQLLWFLACATTFGSTACSDGATSKAAHVSTTDGVHAASANAGAASAVAGRPLSFQAQPGDTCRVTPEGAPSDPRTTDSIDADSDGVVRFYPPPPSSSWGAKLLFACGPRGGPLREHHVDENDASTFTPVPDSFASRGVTGKRPALASSQLGMSVQDLLKNGYPPRPDAVKTPDLYTKWLNIVTTPYDVISSTPITALGVKSSIQFDGPRILGNTPIPVPWTALVQDSAGFAGRTDNYPMGLAGNHYDIYVVDMYNIMPSCPRGQLCETSFWGGLGGYPTANVGLPLFTALLQSGIQFEAGWNSGVAFGGGALFIEYISSDVINNPAVNPQYVPIPAGQMMNVGDEIQAVGYPSNGYACQVSNPDAGNYACFDFYDLTQNWQTGLYLRGFPGGNSFVGSTAEFAAEWNDVPTVVGPAQNVGYFAQAMAGEAFDYNGNAHMASTGDPYILIEQPGVTGSDEINRITFSVPFGQQFADNDPQTWFYVDWVSNQ